MVRKLAVMVVTLLVLLASSSIQGVVAQEKGGEVTKISFVNGMPQDGKVPMQLDPLMKAVKEVHANATFGVKDGTLIVGLNAKGPLGEVLTVKVSSDCPVNSQFQYKAESEEIAKVLQSTLEAWTRVRHTKQGLARAKVGKYNHNKDLGWAEVILTTD